MKAIPGKVVIIQVDDCPQCPINNKCERFAELKAKEKFLWTCGTGIPKAVLDECPLKELD